VRNHGTAGQRAHTLPMQDARKEPAGGAAAAGSSVARPCLVRSVSSGSLRYPLSFSRGAVRLVRGHSLFVCADCPLGEARHAELVGGGARLLEEPAALG
jgi:hypothetical protein